jgi:hypothetical protein
MENFEKAWRQLREQSLETKHLHVSLKEKSFISHAQSLRLPSYSKDKTYIINCIKKLFEHIYTPDVLYRSTSIMLYELSYPISRQLSLTANTKENEHTAQDNLFHTIEKLNHQAGKILISSASNYVHHRESKRNTLESLTLI